MRSGSAQSCSCIIVALFWLRRDSELHFPGASFGREECLCQKCSHCWRLLDQEKNSRFVEVIEIRKRFSYLAMGQKKDTLLGMKTYEKTTLRLRVFTARLWPESPPFKAPLSFFRMSDSILGGFHLRLDKAAVHSAVDTCLS